MTQTTVIGSQSSQAVNLMNLTQSTGKVDKAGFKDFLNTSRQNADKNPSADVKTDRKPALNNEKQNNPKIDKTESKGITKKTEKQPEVTKAPDETDVDNVKDAVSKVCESLEEEFDVSEEEILNALETLGLTALALLDADRMPEIVAKLTGSEDVLSLVTDEDLYGKLLSVTETVGEAKENLMTLENLEPGEFNEALKEFEAVKNVREADAEIPEKGIGNAEKLEDKITVNVQNRSEIRNAYERSSSGNNLTENISTTETEESFKTEAMDGSHEEDSSREDFSRQEKPMSFAFNLLEKTAEVMEAAKPEAVYSKMDVENIINQMTRAIRVEITPETSEINLRLHPESLGNVSVKIVANHEGVLTAEFTAQNESVKAVIESQAMVLRETLEAKGVTVEAVEVLVQSHEFERNLDGERQNGSAEGNTQRRRGLRRINLSEESLNLETSEDDNLVKEMMAQNGNTVDYSA